MLKKELERKLESLKRENAELSEENAEMLNVIDSCNSEIDKLKDQRNDRREKIQKLRIDNYNLKASNDELERNFSTVSESLRELKHTYIIVTSKLTSKL